MPATPRRQLPARIRSYLAGAAAELRRVSWPTATQTRAFTVVTGITVVALTVFVFAADVALKEAVLWVVGRR